MSSKKVIVVVASGLALTGVDAGADIVVDQDEAGIAAAASTHEFDALVFGAAADLLDLPALVDAEDEVKFDDRYAQTWGGGTGNDGLVGGPQAPGTRLDVGSPRLDPISKPIATPKLETKSPSRQLQPQKRESRKSRSKKN